MSLYQRDDLVLSKGAMAFRLDLAECKRTDRGRFSWTIPGIRIGRKNGRNTVSMGKIWDSVENASTIDELFRDYDGRYGLGTQIKWDGVDLWTDSSTYNWYQIVGEIFPIIDKIHKGLPDIPEGYTGWFYNENKRLYN